MSDEEKWYINAEAEKDPGGDRRELTKGIFSILNVLLPMGAIFWIIAAVREQTESTGGKGAIHWITFGIPLIAYVLGWWYLAKKQRRVGKFHIGLRDPESTVVLGSILLAVFLLWAFLLFV